MKRRRNPFPDMVEGIGKLVALVCIGACVYYTSIEIIWPWLKSLLQ